MVFEPRVVALASLLLQLQRDGSCSVWICELLLFNTFGLGYDLTSSARPRTDSFSFLYVFVESTMGWKVSTTNLWKHSETPRVWYIGREWYVTKRMLLLSV